MLSFSSSFFLESTNTHGWIQCTRRIVFRVYVHPSNRFFCVIFCFSRLNAPTLPVRPLPLSRRESLTSSHCSFLSTPVFPSFSVSPCLLSSLARRLSACLFLTFARFPSVFFFGLLVFLLLFRRSREPSQYPQGRSSSWTITP